jgi:hypothetical protein
MGKWDKRPSPPEDSHMLERTSRMAESAPSTPRNTALPPPEMTEKEIIENLDNFKRNPADAYKSLSLPSSTTTSPETVHAKSRAFFPSWFKLKKSTQQPPHQ